MGDHFNGERFNLRRLDIMFRFQFPFEMAKAFGLGQGRRVEIYLEDEKLIFRPCNEGDAATAGVQSVFRYVDAQRRIRPPIMFLRTLSAKEGTVLKFDMYYDEGLIIATKYSQLKEIAVASKNIIKGLQSAIDKPILITDMDMVVGGAGLSDKHGYYGVELSRELTDYIASDSMSEGSLSFPDMIIAKELPHAVDFIYPIYGAYCLMGTIIGLKISGFESVMSQNDINNYYYAVKTATKIIQMEMNERRKNYERTGKHVGKWKLPRKPE